MRFRHRRTYNVGPIFGLLAFLFVAAIPFTYNFGTGDSGTVTIDKVWTKLKNGEEYYLASDSNGNTYKIDDTFLRFHFDSSDVYALMLKNEGGTFDIDYYGWRVPFLSMYPNIYDARLAND